MNCLVEFLLSDITIITDTCFIYVWSYIQNKQVIHCQILCNIWRLFTPNLNFHWSRWDSTPSKPRGIKWRLQLLCSSLGILFLWYNKAKNAFLKAGCTFLIRMVFFSLWDAVLFVQQIVFWQMQLYHKKALSTIRLVAHKHSWAPGFLKETQQLKCYWECKMPPSRLPPPHQSAEFSVQLFFQASLCLWL